MMIFMIQNSLALTMAAYYIRMTVGVGCANIIRVFMKDPLLRINLRVNYSPVEANKKFPRQLKNFSFIKFY